MSPAIARGARRFVSGVLCAGALALGGATPAQAAYPEPDFVLFPHEIAPTPSLAALDLQSPCGIAVSGAGNVYVANYYRRSIDVFSTAGSELKLLSRLPEVTPTNGPCGLGVDDKGVIHANVYHGSVEKFAPSSNPPNPSTTYAFVGRIDDSDPTGVAVDPLTGEVYINARTHIAAYDSSGAPLLDGEGQSLRIGQGSLGNGYGLALSRFSLAEGRLYVPDREDGTIKVYDPETELDDPVEVIDGGDLPGGGFGSLRDSAIAVDRISGEVYVADTNAHPQHTERPEATIHVFSHTGSYKGRLKYNVIDSSPPGLAVDNSGGATQGRVYVTSGNTVRAAVYAYPPGSATIVGAPAVFPLALSAVGSGSGLIASSTGVACDRSCDAQIPATAQATVTATPEEGSAFIGWSGGGCSGTGTCTVKMTQARSVSAEFAAISGPPAPTADNPSSPPPGAGAGTSSPAARPPARAKTSVITQKGNLRVTVDGKLAPRRLPRKGAAPIAVSVGGQISTTDDSLPPQLKALRVELNRNGRLDHTGLPTCNQNQIQPGSSSRALAQCRSALVGRGSFTANITLAGQEPYPTKGRLLVFNGTRKGKPVLFGHIYSGSPFATSFVIVFAIQKTRRGTYGIVLNAPLPKAMDAWGRLTGLQMTLKRRYSHKGQRRSFISAGCPAPKGFPGATFPLARTSFSFEGGRKLAPVLISSCRARG